MRQAVMSFPTFLILKNGTVVDRVVGAIADPKLRAKIDAVL
jgi:thiol-disulfide isomerase/thioredoxin